MTPAIVVEAFLISASRSLGSREPKMVCALRACSSGPVRGRSAGGGMGGGGTVFVADWMAFRGAFKASSAYSLIGLVLADVRVLLKAAREACCAGLVWARLSNRMAREAHCDRIL